MDDINNEIEQIDVCMVVGANDVVNPVARTNPLFAADNCLMMFGDGKKAITELVTALKEG